MSYLEHRKDSCQTPQDAIEASDRVIAWRRKMFEPQVKPKPVDDGTKVAESLNFEETICEREFIDAFQALDPRTIQFVAHNLQRIEKIILSSFVELKTTVENATEVVNIRKVLAAVARAFQCRVEDLISSRRNREIVIPRQICYAFCRRFTLRSYPEIGRRMGDRDHSAIIHGARKMEPLMAAIEATIGPNKSLAQWAEAAVELHLTIIPSQGRK